MNMIREVFVRIRVMKNVCKKNNEKSVLCSIENRPIYRTRRRLGLRGDSGVRGGAHLRGGAALSAHAGPQIRFLSDFLNIFAVF